MNKPGQTIQKPLSDQQDALELYLNALLSEVEETYAQESEKPTIECFGENASSTEGAIRQADVNLPARKKLLNVDIPPANPASVLDVRSDNEIDVIPSWAKSRFQVLSFDLGGKLCSISVNMIAGIIPTPPVLTYLPRQAPWLMGLHRHKCNTISVFDLAMIIEQSKSREDIGSGATVSRGYIVLIGDGSWGFIIKKLEKMISLFSDDVKWKPNRFQSNIAIGTISQNMSTLLDIEVVLKSFKQESKP